MRRIAPVIVMLLLLILLLLIALLLIALRVVEAARRRIARDVRTAVGRIDVAVIGPHLRLIRTWRDLLRRRQ